MIKRLIYSILDRLDRELGYLIRLLDVGYELVKSKRELRDNMKGSNRDPNEHDMEGMNYKERLKLSGIEGKGVNGEVVYYGKPDLEKAVQMLMKSPTHKEVIKDGRYKYMTMIMIPDGDNAYIVANYGDKP